eukprot:CAMPEP_0172455434 /NCGR_PEP_ID=MMETSP1065-20121228/12062_1 /TAXON_ID=265537 /ORGANISM="Amphiprora paludosa, Strain CCMP125" /LENGTH=321 /DNA_ID=CAMNT_0013207895 /DNA_START=389 /DNA_END=1354 /DNA_ORIENTATION=-
MFIVHTVRDTILIQSHALSQSTAQAIHHEIDLRYPNRVLMDVGLVIARYGDSLEQVSHGVCVAGQAGAHHHCSFRLIVFRPFVEEVCLGKVLRSTEEGLYVSLGFFEDIFIPAYWMLKPSAFDEKSGLWVWAPSDEDDEDDEGDGAKEYAKPTNGEEEKSETGKGVSDNEKVGGPTTTKTEESQASEKEGEPSAEDNQFFQMEIGAEIRFKVKSIHFARITDSAKGRQAVLSTTDKALARKKPKQEASPEAGEGSSKDDPKIPSPSRPVRRRSSSVGLDDETALPPTMHIVASICEDGLGLTRWWDGGDEEEDVEDKSGDE